MNRNNLISTLEQIKASTEELLQELGRATRAPRKGLPPEKKKGTPKSLPTWILKLRDEGLFRQARTAVYVHGKLQAHYPCDIGKVRVALIRLQRRKQLRKTSLGIGSKKQVAYVW